MAWASVEAEQAVLGGLMISPSAWGAIAGAVTADDFSSEKHRLIFRACRLVVDNQRSPDVVTIAEELDRSGDLVRIGGLPYLGVIADNTPSAANIRAYAEIVRDRAKRRAARDLFASAAKEAEAGDLSAVLSETTTKASRIAVGGSRALSFAEAMDLGLQHIEEAAAARKAGGMVGVPTGLPAIDNRTGGLQRGRLVILAARPSIGKTALALQVAIHAARKGHRVGFVSLEMTAEELAIRAAAHTHRLNFSKLLYGDAGEIAHFHRCKNQHRLADLAIHLDTETASLSGITARLAEWRATNGIDLAIVDHIGLIEGGDEKTRNDWMGQVSRTLKLTAKRLALPVLAVSQLNRSVERDKRRPILADLRDSGNIEQDADIAVFLHVDGEENVPGGNGITMQIGLLKNRTGRRGWLPEKFLFEGKTQTIHEVQDSMI